MFYGRPAIVTARLDGGQVELTLLHQIGLFFKPTKTHFCVPDSTIHETGEFATITLHLLFPPLGR